MSTKMDPALLQQRELFKKRAIATPTVEKKKREKETERDDAVLKKPKVSSSSSASKIDTTSYKTTTGSSQYKFSVLAKIVKHLKTKYQENDDYPLSLDEILDETNQLDVGSKVKQWLQTEALAQNPKIEMLQDGRFIFKPTYKIKDRKSLLKLLKQQDLKGLGGILLDDIQESLPQCEKYFKNLQNEIIVVQRPLDKKKVIFYHDKMDNIQIDEDFQKLWRSVPVDAIDDQKIDEHLEKQGIAKLSDHGLKKAPPIKRKKAANKRKHLKKPRDNEHMADLLETYGDDK
ncbi:Similar to GTF2E2: General transcription factor IIE subunit 2 (Bos taurus) [Cotesia congregata]|uniref:Transcription initiation factor IIE subunit beta n=1 Tax=Cotesia congregata TaxID=51543 RepID=A0A8J2H7B2_COTCN|nr:Similar to GTF2E2: General transcription factor IIE subunit 2 (Bos taurus) [Cotesia congregata]